MTQVSSVQRGASDFIGLYERSRYAEARDALKALHAELEQGNQSAAAILAEGLEETLSLHRLECTACVGNAQDDELPREHDPMV